LPQEAEQDDLAGPVLEVALRRVAEPDRSFLQLEGPFRVAVGPPVVLRVGPPREEDRVAVLPVEDRVAVPAEDRVAVPAVQEARRE
jgi:hypothetical protein